MRMPTPALGCLNGSPFKERHDRPRCLPAEVLREVLEAARQMVLNRAAKAQMTREDGEPPASFLLVNESDVRGPGRHKDVMRTRHVYAAMCRRFTDASWPEIAAGMGRTKHTSAISAANSLHRNFERDPQLRAIYGAACLMLAARNRIGIRVDEGVEPGEVALWRRWANGQAEGTPRVVDQGLGTGVGSGVPTNA